MAAAPAPRRPAGHGATAWLHTLGQLADLGLLSVHSLLQQSLEYRHPATGSGDSRHRSSTSGSRRSDVLGHSRYSKNILSRSVATTATATGSAIKWSRTGTIRVAYFHAMFLHALQTGNTDVLVQLWPRVPPAYSLQAVVTTMRYALQHPAASSSSTTATTAPASIPLWAVAPALQVLAALHRRELEDMAALWRRGAMGTGSGAVLREWGKA